MQDIGEKGELLAKEYLINKGYEIWFTNWRNKRAEIDIIAKDGKTAVFVEVKTRNNDSFGHPEDFVDTVKRRKMHEAAAAFIEWQDWLGELRFDIIAIGRDGKVVHFEDAFY